MFRIEAELPSGTRISLQRDASLWCATFASFQFVIRPGETETFDRRAREWCEANIGGESLTIAYSLVRQFTMTVAVVDAALLATEERVRERARK